MTFEEIIAVYRKKLGLTQEALANRLGVTNQAVSKWELGQSCPDITLLPVLADLFGITIDQLFGREPKQEAPKAEPVRELPWPDDGTLRVVLYAGHQLLGNDHPAAQEVHFCYEGPALNVHSAVSVTCGAVMGDVTSGGDVWCDTVHGHAQAGGDISCDDIMGNVQAHGDVSCDDVEGSVKAEGDVTCDSVEGNVTAGGDVTCDSVAGDLVCGGSRF